MTADGTNLCDTNRESIAFPDVTRPCFSGFGDIGIPGTQYPVDPPTLVPFDDTIVVNPSTVTIVVGGVITTEGRGLCSGPPFRSGAPSELDPQPG